MPVPTIPGEGKNVGTLAVSPHAPKKKKGQHYFHKCFRYFHSKILEPWAPVLELPRPRREELVCSRIVQSRSAQMRLFAFGLLLAVLLKCR
jgi:hypothetical protein